MSVTNEYSDYSASFFFKGHLFVGAKNRISVHSGNDMRKVNSKELIQCPINNNKCTSYVEVIDSFSDEKLVVCTKNEVPQNKFTLYCGVFSEDFGTVLTRITQADTYDSIFMFASSGTDRFKVLYFAGQDKTNPNVFNAISLQAAKLSLKTSNIQIDLPMARFIGGYWYNSRVFLMFNEKLAEETKFNNSKLINYGSRIAQICTNDPGTTSNQLLSFEKSYLRCGVTLASSFDIMYAASAIYNYYSGGVLGLMTYSVDDNQKGAFCAFGGANKDFPNSFYANAQFQCFDNNGQISRKTDDDLMKTFKDCTFTRGETRSVQCPLRLPVNCEHPYNYDRQKAVLKMIAITIGLTKYIFALTTDGKLELHVYIGATGCLLNAFTIEEKMVETYHFNFRVYDDEKSCVESGIEFCVWHHHCTVITDQLEKSQEQWKKIKQINCTRDAFGAYSSPYSCLAKSKEQCFNLNNNTGITRNTCATKNDGKRCKCRARTCIRTTGCGSGRNFGYVEKSLMNCEFISIEFGTNAIPDKHTEAKFTGRQGAMSSISRASAVSTVGQSAIPPISRTDSRGKNRRSPSPGPSARNDSRRKRRLLKIVSKIEIQRLKKILAQLMNEFKQ
ncbi:hypothetical protein B4U80_13601 [Leptotrombidium deliense]|uniref:Sema domain-containing protein n=1 Tax=Leptotrombidium deliense TaxID=299467 RepID=A0A443SUU1_9ACAR|nr:hypothetical protein B4U80_13601 [Leptotrombidium deliense]